MSPEEIDAFLADLMPICSKHGLVFSGTTPDEKLVEIIELPDHPFYIASQFHPEFQSKPHQPHPLFKGFIAAAHQHSHRKPL